MNAQEARQPERLLLTPDFPPVVGGVQTLLHQVAHRFGPGMVVITAWQPECEEFDAAQSYRVIRVRFDSPRIWKRTRALLSAAQSVLQQFPIRFVHCGHVDFSFAAARLADKNKLPWLLYSYAQEILALRSGLRSWFYRRCMRRADSHLTISRYTQSLLEHYGAETQRIHRIPLGADLAHFKPGLDASLLRRHLNLAGKKVLLTVGRLVARKGHRTVIDTLPEVARAVPNVIYLIVGDGPQRQELQRFARSRGVEDRVVFVGAVSGAELPLYYSICDLFVMPACAEEVSGDVEGFGLVFLEAAACAKAVIGGRSGGIPDAVLDGKTGVLVDPNDATQLAVVMSELLGDATLCERMGLAGAQWVRETMNWEATLNAIKEVELGLSKRV